MFELKVVVGITIVVWWSIVTGSEGNVVRDEDICGVQNGRRLYLELGEKGVLYAKNVSYAKYEPRQGGSRVYTSNSSHSQCSLELVTCPSCVIVVTFQSIALSHHCGDGSATMDSPCRCDYVWISEPPYEDVSGTPFCGLYAPITYRSSTRTLSITLLYSQFHKHAFTLEYTAERNRLQLRGSELTAKGQAVKGLNNTGGGILTSPFFPARYPRDLGLEYIVTCQTEAPSCRIRLLFSDFQLATVSIMEFYDWNGQRLDVSSGARFRPPVIMSSGPSLLIRFYANGGTGLGYKAFYSFVIGHPLEKSAVQPITDCGGYVENLGGAITMMDMIGEGVKTYDCVWLIRPPKNFLHMKTHMYLKVVTFADMAGNTELIVKQGPTSALLPLEILRHPASQVQPPRHREHVAPVTNGFHVSLRGTFGPSSHLAIAYAAFSYMDCFAGSDFLCRNHRCIPNQLNCDGFDHCGDNSDEPATCFRDWEVEPQDRKWHASKANYYFPKIDRYPDLKTATLVFVASSLGLIILISALIVLLYRMGARARQQRELQSRLQTISELLDGARIDEISVSDEPPVYEAPPGYEEIVKLGFDSEIVGRKKRKTLGREALLNRNSSPNQSCALDVGRSSDTGSTSHGSVHASPTSVLGSKGSKKRSSCFPESPPPPYVTPPGSMARCFGISALAIVSDGHERDIAHQKQDDDDDDDNRQELEMDDEGAAGEGGSRRNWFRRIDDRQYSLPRFGNSDPSLAATIALSVDTEFFGAYPWNRHASSSIQSADATCDSQRKKSHDASNDTKLACGDRGDEEGQPVEHDQVPETKVDLYDQPAEERRPEAADLAVCVEDKLKPSGAFASGCCCEGACGCATANRLWPLRRVSAKLDDRLEREGEVVAGQEERRDNEDDGVEEEEEVEEEVEGSCMRSRSTIVRLLGSRAGKWQNGSGVSTVVSTATSTPCGTLRRSMRKLSTRSRDSCLARTATIGSISSYEKLESNEFAVPRSSLHASEPSSIGSHGQRRTSRRYSSCDLENLYEKIKVLDGFLARRGVTVARSRKQSVTVMLFGTPEHGAIRRRQAGDRRSTRVSGFSLDAISN